MAAAQPVSWFPLERAASLSRELSDPPEVAANRREAASRFAGLPLEPNPLYRQYGYFAGVDLTGLDAEARGPAVPTPPLGPRTVQIVHDASGTRFARSADLHDDDVRFVPLAELWANDPKGAVEFCPDPSDQPDRLSALSHATLNRGYRLTVAPRRTATVRVQDLSVLSRPREALSVHRSIVVGDGSSAIVTEEAFSTPSPGGATQRLLASTTRLELGRETRVLDLAVHAPDERTVAVYRRAASLGQDSRLTWMWHGFGGFRTKVRNQTDLPGSGSDVEDLQTFFGEATQSYDSSVQITHQGTNTHGQSITRGVFRDESRGMSRGLVRIEPEARGTLSYLSEHAMLLNRGARSDTIPILEILCRDVKATHSSSVAPVDPEKVFYLESRGLPRESAVRMIGEGFLSHVLDRSPVPGLRDILYPILATRWEGRPIRWGEGPLPSLPTISASGAAGGVDWRFDAKLR